MHELVKNIVLFSHCSEVLKDIESSKHIFVPLTEYGRICIYE